MAGLLLSEGGVGALGVGGGHRPGFCAPKNSTHRHATQATQPSVEFSSEATACLEGLT